MKAWRIHVAWAIVTVLATVITARIIPRRCVPEAPIAAVLRKTETPDPLPANFGTRRVDQAASEAAQASTGSPPAHPDPSFADRIRALMKTQDWAELEKLLNSVPDRTFRLGLLKEALFGEDRMSCNSAITLLSGMKGRDVAELLESYLIINPDKDPAANVASALGEVGDPGSMQVLIDALQSRNPQVQLWCAESLLKMGYSAPADDLISAMEHQFESPDGAVRRKAIETVSQFDRAGVVPLLTRALKDSNGDVRMTALSGFLTLNNPEYVPLLQPLLNDPIPEIASQAKEFIEALKKP